MVLSTNWSQQPNAISQAAAGLLVLFWSENGLLRKAMGFKATNEGFQWLLRCYLVGGLEHFLFFHILGIITPTDFHILQRGWNQQPVIYPRSYPFFGPGESFPSVDQGIQHWPCTGIMTGNLVGGFKHGLYFSTIYGITLPIDELRFSRWLKPPTRNMFIKSWQVVSLCGSRLDTASRLDCGTIVDSEACCWNPNPIFPA